MASAIDSQHWNPCIRMNQTKQIPGKFVEMESRTDGIPYNRWASIKAVAAATVPCTGSLYGIIPTYDDAIPNCISQDES
jgi:hypothetical protein